MLRSFLFLGFASLGLGLVGCSAKVDGGQPIAPFGPQKHAGPVAPASVSMTGTINSQSWKAASGEARWDSSLGHQMLAFDFWANPSRVPCAPESVSNNNDLQVTALVAPIPGTTTFDANVSSDGPHVGFAYFDSSMPGMITNVAPEGSFTITAIDADHAAGSFDASVSGSNQGSGTFSVPICP